jgi:hypothetical protein
MLTYFGVTPAPGPLVFTQTNRAMYFSGSNQIDVQDIGVMMMWLLLVLLLLLRFIADRYN